MCQEDRTLFLISYLEGNLLCLKNYFAPHTYYKDVFLYAGIVIEKSSTAQVFNARLDCPLISSISESITGVVVQYIPPHTQIPVRSYSIC